ncbi:MAG: hypothetical protein HFJ25_03810 [Clostridia bacterium]|nr:hypothetical protein [Clostridia bacterium]
MNLKFTLVHCLKAYSEKSNKDFYKVSLISSQGNLSNVFVSKETYEKCLNLLYKDITNYVNLVYDQETGLYKPFIKF